MSFARERIAPGSTISADEIAHWDRLEPGFDVHRINHSDAYSRDGVHTNLRTFGSNYLKQGRFFS